MNFNFRELIVIRLSVAMIYSSYSIQIPFLPNMAENHFLINWQIGIILASYASGG